MRIAVIGLGSAGGRHSRLAAALGHRVTGYDPAASPPEGVDDAESLESALQDADAAVIASPSAMHAEHSLTAIAAGVPVLVEKPLATSGADARRVSAAAEKARLSSGMAMNLRFHAGPIALRQLARGGELGQVLFAHAYFGHDLRLWRPGTDYRRSYSARAALGGGILLDAIHEIDELLWLLGPARSVIAETAHVSDLEIDVEDLAQAAVRFESGAAASLDLNFFEPAYRRGCLLVGERAVADWDWVRGTVVVRKGDEKLDELPGATQPEDAYREELEDFVSAVERGQLPRATLAEGAVAVELVEASKRSAAEGRRIELAG